MKTHNFYPILVSVSLLTSLSAEMLFSCGHSGAKGYVYLVRGNQMPSPSPDRAQPKPKGIKAKLYIYSLTNIRDVIRQGNSAFYSSISSQQVKEVETDENGYFKVELKPGWYSLFSKKDALYYSSQFDEKNNIHPIEVKRGKTTEVVFNVNYDAVY